MSDKLVPVMVPYSPNERRAKQRGKGYDSTVARIAGNLLSGATADWLDHPDPKRRGLAVAAAVETARAIVEVTRTTEPKERTHED